MPEGLSYRSVGSDGTPWPTWVRELVTKSGAYVIKAAGDDGHVLYVGSSDGRLYDTITRHFQQWQRRKQWWRGLRGAHHDPGITYSRARCLVAVRVTARGAHLEVEADLIQRLQPRDNLVQNPDGGEVPF